MTCVRIRSGNNYFIAYRRGKGTTLRCGGVFSMFARLAIYNPELRRLAPHPARLAGVHFFPQNNLTPESIPAGPCRLLGGCLAACPCVASEPPVVLDCDFTIFSAFRANGRPASRRRASRPPLPLTEILSRMQIYIKGDFAVSLWVELRLGAKLIWGCILVAIAL